MKKVIPKKKNAFQVLNNSKVSELISFQSPSFQSPFFQGSSMSCSPSVKTEVSKGVARENIYAGDLVMLDENGMVVPFKGPEGKSNV